MLFNFDKGDGVSRRPVVITLFSQLAPKLAVKIGLRPALKIIM